MKRFARVVIVVAVSFCALVEMVGVTCVDRFMFHPELVHGTYDASEPGYVDLGTGGERVAALVLGPKRGGKAILRCHGNAEDMCESVALLRALVDRGFTVAAVDYPGYGLSSGDPTEEGCYRNVRLLYRYLRDTCGFAPKDIVVDGFSIGTGPATELASSEPVGGLVLEAPFLSAPRVVTGVRLLPIDPFPNARRLATGLGCPLLILHGTEDTVVPFSQGRRLYEISRGGGGNGGRDCRFIPVEGADHAEIARVMGTAAYLDLIASFANRVPAARSAVRPKERTRAAAAEKSGGAPYAVE